MLKLVGMVLVFFSLSGMGVILNFALTEKRERLITLKSLITELLNDLNYRKTTTEDIIRRIKKDKKYKHFSFLENLTFPVNREVSDENMSDEEMVIFLEILDILGSSDSKSQISLLRLTEEKLDELIQTATREKQDKGKLFSVCGVLAGVLLVILMI